VELLARLREGDERALEEIIVAYRAPLTRFVSHLTTFDEADIEDVLARVFFGLWEHRTGLDATSSLRAYLFAATRNQTLNRVRDTRHERYTVAMTDDAALTPPVDQLLEARDLAQAVHLAIEALPARCREIFLLSRDGGLSYPEIAHTTGVSVNTVKTQMTRALAALARAAGPFLAMVVAITR